MMKLKSTMFCSLFLFFSLGVTSCMSFGDPFPSDTDWIEKNQTSREDVIMLLGEPYSVGSSDGTPVWTYLYSKYSMGEPLKQKELKIFWNHQGDSVKYYQFNSSFPEDLKAYSKASKKSYPKKKETAQ